MEQSHIEGLREWMSTGALGGGSIADVVPLGGGTQNVMLRFRRGADTFVLRAPPAHRGARGEEMLRREVSLLAALRDTAIPHASLIAACWDASIIGAPFYLMGYVEGFNAAHEMPARHAADPRIRRRMGFAFVEAAAGLGLLNPNVIGLSSFGRPEGFLERQLARWGTELERYTTYRGWPGPEELGDVEAVGSWLTRNMPAAGGPGIVHGDYHLANVLFSSRDAEVAAIVDWELATIGDPLLDLGWILATWSDDRYGEPAVVPASPWEGFPTRDELTARYAQCSSRDLSALDWYTVLACYKLGILLEGSYARACAGLVPADIGALLHARARVLLGRGRRIVASA
jgi:aminoglycoside phosphotransferase (APT) family kinase protein